MDVWGPSMLKQVLIFGAERTQILIEEVSSLFRLEKRIHSKYRLISLPWVHYYPAKPTPHRPRHLECFHLGLNTSRLLCQRKNMDNLINTRLELNKYKTRLLTEIM